MGLFDRFSEKKAPPPKAPSDTLVPASGAPAAGPNLPVPAALPEGSAANVFGRLRAARERLEAKDLAGAVAIYDEILKSSGDRADVLVTISGDLGSTGHVTQIVELIAPRYDAGRHGPAAGFNLLQAYLAVRDTDAAQHVLDLLFALNRPDLEERLFGFSNALADLLLTGTVPGGPTVAISPDEPVPVNIPKVGLVTISKPIWFYGLEPLADRILPPKEGALRRIAFAQLALPGAQADSDPGLRGPEEEMGRLTRAIPTWLAEIFYFSLAYAPVSAVAFFEESDLSRRAMMFSTEWGIENLRQLVDTTTGGLDYIFTGTLRQKSGDYELSLRLWEVKKFRERKLFTARWTPATVEAELTQLRRAICQFMEWSPYPAGSGMAYEVGVPQRDWMDTLAASLSLFLAKQKIIPADSIPPLAPAAALLAEAAPRSALASLSWLTLRDRARTLGLDAGPAEVALAVDPLIGSAVAALQG
jgi:hypothetical protein